MADTQNPTPSKFGEPLTSNPTPSNFGEPLTENPTPVAFGGATDNPTPSNFIIPTHPTDEPSYAPTPTSFVFSTSEPTYEPSFAPTPTSYVFSTSEPTYEPTHVPTPSSYVSSSCSPTISPTTYIAPTVAPTASGHDAALVIIGAVVLVVLSCVCMMVFCFFAVSKKKNQVPSSPPDETTPLTQPTGRARKGPKTPLPGVAGPDEEAGDGALGEFGSESAAVNAALKKGVILHTSKGPKEVKMFLRNLQLQMWRSGKLFQINLRDVAFLQEGKKTFSFASKGSQQTTGSDPERDDDDDGNSCVSVVTQSTSLDFELSSREARDAFVASLRKILDDQRRDAIESDVHSSNASTA